MSGVLWEFLAFIYIKAYGLMLAGALINMYSALHHPQEHIVN
jgi:hypothetical protein